MLSDNYFSFLQKENRKSLAFIYRTKCSSLNEVRKRVGIYSFEVVGERRGVLYAMA